MVFDGRAHPHGARPFRDGIDLLGFEAAVWPHERRSRLNAVRSQGKALMLFGLKRMLPAIEGGALGEGAVYRMARLYEHPQSPRVRPGLVQCPICGASAMRFLPFGLAGRPNAQCPTCGSVERHRFLWLYLLRRTNLLTGRYRMLHTAPEPPLEARLRPLPNLRYTSVDLFNPNADVQADLTDLPFRDGAFDAVISSHVLEHIRDDHAAMRELARVLRPGGRAIVMVPHDPKRPRTYEDWSVNTAAGRMRAFGHPFHYRIYGADCAGRLEQAGFAVTVIGSASLFTPHQRRRFRINRNYLFDCVRR